MTVEHFNPGGTHDSPEAWPYMAIRRQPVWSQGGFSDREVGVIGSLAFLLRPDRGVIELRVVAAGSSAGCTVAVDHVRHARWRAEQGL